jgi:hypothetical protein
MEIREFTQYNERLPFTGFGVWISLGSIDRKVHLLHPIHLVEYFATEYEMAKWGGSILWPFNNSGSHINFEAFVERFEKRIKIFLESGRSFPIDSVARALADLKEISLDEAFKFIGDNSLNKNGESFSNYVSNKTVDRYNIRKGANTFKLEGRALTIIEALKENGPMSIQQLNTYLEGRMKTINPINRAVTYYVNKFARMGILDKI